MLSAPITYVLTLVTLSSLAELRAMLKLGSTQPSQFPSFIYVRSEVQKIASEETTPNSSASGTSCSSTSASPGCAWGRPPWPLSVVLLHIWHIRYPTIQQLFATVTWSQCYDLTDVSTCSHPPMFWSSWFLTRFNVSHEKTKIVNPLHISLILHFRSYDLLFIELQLPYAYSRFSSTDGNAYIELDQGSHFACYISCLTPFQPNETKKNWLTFFTENQWQEVFSCFFFFSNKKSSLVPSLSSWTLENLGARFQISHAPDAKV